jgi:hypothetical protein
MADWITVLCRSFVERFMQEVKVMDSMEELIRRECNIADELVAVIVIQCDELVHTNEHPFCDDPACGCHDDIDLIMEHLEHPFDEGLLTSPEYFRIKEGKQL